MTSALSQTGLDRLHEAMSARVAKGEFPGGLFLVAAGNDVHVDAIGTLATDDDAPVRRETVFRIASMTKPILAAAALMLVEDGTLAFTDPVERWLPELAERRVLNRLDGPLDDTVPAVRPITVEDVLASRMGYGILVQEGTFPVLAEAERLRLGLGAPDPRIPHDPDEWLRRLATLPLMAQPGERWHYNVASMVLGVLVARAAGQPLADVLEARVFAPLGMRQTGFWLPAERIGRLPSYYLGRAETGELRWHEEGNATDWTTPPAFPSGAGGLLSTAEDFLAFARMLLNRGAHGGERLLSEESVARMTTNQLTPQQRADGGWLLSGNGWGYGVAVTTEPTDGWPVPGRYGWAGGYGTTWFNDPSRRQVAIALTQTTDFIFGGASTEFDKLSARCGV